MPDLDFSPIRPRFARIAVAMVILLVIAGITFLLLQTESSLPGWKNIDRILLVFTGALAIAFIYRHGAVAAFPSEKGLKVRNLIFTRTLEWEEIVRVSFAPGKPWASLDLSDGRSLPLMAIQASDGKYGRAQARRLAALVAHYEASE